MFHPGMYSQLLGKIVRTNQIQDLVCSVYFFK